MWSADTLQVRPKPPKNDELSFILGIALAVAILAVRQSNTATAISTSTASVATQVPTSSTIISSLTTTVVTLTTSVTTTVATTSSQTTTIATLTTLPTTTVTTLAATTTSVSSSMTTSIISTTSLTAITSTTVTTIPTTSSNIVAGPDASCTRWYCKDVLTFKNTGTLIALTVVITVQKTVGAYSPNIWTNLAGGIYTSSIVDNGSQLIYTYTLNTGSTLASGSYGFGGNYSLTGTVQDTTADTWTISYTDNSNTITTEAGHF
ncbi:unnamed protein product [Didymodactylos carnosus]|uniref:Uncharacterized protein n=1 Tax=Didymodactylos carnosus TaxID=1234261 RepID=A0A8S2NYQ3_9BILA|nr:unnamed protein product [Didymodactylos carnosus]CAF4024557.1 unnamed protein product [Didymodactylos carnosus]